MILELDELTIECILGDLPAERTRPQPIRLNLRMELDETASQTDRLEDTVDYATLVRRLGELLVHARCRLLEHAAKLVADEILGFDRRVRSVMVRVSKFGSVPGLRTATAEFEGERS